LETIFYPADNKELFGKEVAKYKKEVDGTVHTSSAPALDVIMSENTNCFST